MESTLTGAVCPKKTKAARRYLSLSFLLKIVLKRYPVVCYKARDDELAEPAKYQLIGEDEEDIPESLPIRVLSDFSIFDPRHSNEMMSLEAMDTDEGHDRVFSAAGYVKANREDEEVEDQAADDADQPIQYMRLRTIVAWTMSLVKLSEYVRSTRHSLLIFAD